MSLPDGMSTNGAPPSGKFSRLQTEVLPFPPISPAHRKRSDIALVTWVAGKEARDWFAITGPAMSRYARAVGADLVVLEGYAAQPYALANKFRVKQLFDECGYERVLYVDGDILIVPDCENLFETVSPDKVAILDEGQIYDYWMLAHFRHEAAELLISQGYDPRNSRVPSPKNAGLYLISRTHSAALTPPSRPFPLCYRNGATVEQTWFCLNLERLRVPIHNLRFPDQHWLWYIDQREMSIHKGQFLHFCGMQHAPAKRRDRIEASAQRLLDDSRAGRGGVFSVHEFHGNDLGISEFDRQMLLDSPAPPALRIDDPFTISSHQYGWEVAIKALTVLSSPDGVLFDGFLERTFLWRQAESRAAGIIPYREPWLGVIHHPPGLPNWPSFGKHRLQELDGVIEWSESLRTCLGLFALTEELALWVQERWQVPCEVLRYPAIRPQQTFDPDAFMRCAPRTVLSIGFWMRRFSSFAKLRVHGYHKVRPLLVNDPSAAGLEHIAAYEKDELNGAASPVSKAEIDSVRVVPRLSSDEYDATLARSVVFLDLIAAAGVTTVVECLSRGTPLLINRLRGVEEYLGSDYPLYYRDLDAASSKLSDLGAIRAAHDHMLCNPVRELITPQRFLDSFTSSGGYGRALWSIARSESR